MSEQLTRDAFREAGLARDGGKCVFCKAQATEVHHLIERRLFGASGGYFLDNGISVCNPCHIKCEKTLISVEEGRAAAGITKIVVPEHMYADHLIDKWGNPILPNGMRLKGELFDDPSVQKILGEGGVLGLFTNHVKYSRTLHLPWSPSAHNKDERIIEDMSQFVGKRIIVTAKLDGENTSMYSDGIHARSLDFSPHESRNLIKKLHSELAWQIPERWRIVGENLYAKHSIHYKNLESYFYLFSVWNERNECLSWDETVEWAALLDLKTVPVLFDGIYNEQSEKMLKSLVPKNFDGDDCEGYVLRLADSFHYKDFRKYVGKWVRKDHVQTHAFWRTAKVIPNILKDK